MLDSTTGIDQQGQLRAETTNEIATRAGYAFEGDTLFAWGTRLIDVGAETFRQERSGFEARTRAHLVLDEGIARVVAEARRDYPVALPDLHANGIARGEVAVRSDRPGSRDYTPVSRHALGQLLNRADAPAGAFPYLSACLINPDLHTRQIAADHVNHWLTSARASVANPEKKGERKLIPTPAVLRTKLNGVGKRCVYACVSPRYSTTCDLDKVLAAVRGAIDPSAKGVLVYDGASWELTITYMSPIQPVVGEIFNAAIVITGADDGSEAIRVVDAIERARCVNLTRNRAEQSVSLRHNRKALGEVFADALKLAQSRVGEFAERWAAASRNEIASMVADDGPAKVCQRLIDGGHLYAAGVTDADLTERFMRAYAIEPGSTAAAVNNAITRMAHTETWASPWTTAALEEQAGALLYQTVSVYEVQA